MKTNLQKLREKIKEDDMDVYCEFTFDKTCQAILKDMERLVKRTKKDYQDHYLDLYHVIIKKNCPQKSPNVEKLDEMPDYETTNGVEQNSYLSNKSDIGLHSADSIKEKYSKWGRSY